VPPLHLVWRNLTKRKARFLLTAGSLAIAIFLLCLLRSLVVALEAGVKAAAADRLIVQSKVSLFVYLPQSYGPKIASVEGVERVMRWNWFGGYYQDQGNFFAQFACDQDELQAIYPEIQLVDGEWDDFLRDRKACIVGEATASKYGFKVGDSVPIIGALFPKTDGTTWDFRVAGIYKSTKKNVDDATLFFHYKYLENALDSGEGGGPAGSDRTEVMSRIDALFEQGPQVVQTTTEAEFQAQFVSMIGNVPLFVSSIGGGVMVAILLAALNTMLMAAREQTRDIGVLKALGFGDGVVAGVLLWQSLALCACGGGVGILLAASTEDFVAKMLGTVFPGYEVTSATLWAAAGATLLVGLVAGVGPALRARGLSVIDALRRTG
jgi:putative ABC transport system permease protein